MNNLVDALEQWVQQHQEEIGRVRDLRAARDDLYRLAPKVPDWNLVVDFTLRRAGTGSSFEDVRGGLEEGGLLANDDAASSEILKANWETFCRVADLEDATKRKAKEREVLLEMASPSFMEELRRSPSAAVAAWRRAAAVLPYEVGSIVGPPAAQRALAPEDAEVLLRGLSGLEGKSINLFVPPGGHVYKLTFASDTAWLRWVVYAPLLRDTRFVDADFAYATEQLSLADAARITIALCDARSRRGGWLGEPFLWVSLADQVSTGRYRGRNPVDDVLQAHTLVEQLVGSGRIKDPAPLVERLVDVQLGRQLQGLVFDLRRAARTAGLSEVLRGLVGEPSGQPKASRRKAMPAAKRKGKSGARPLGEEDVLALKNALLAAERDEDNPSALKLLVARLQSVAVHVYNEKGANHHRPHVHLRRNDLDVAVVFIDRVEFDNCTLSGKAKQVLLDWAVTYQPQLLAAWNAASAGGTPVRIDR